MPRDRTNALERSALLRHSTLGWRYAPRPGSTAFGSTHKSPSHRTTLRSATLSSALRHPTQVRWGERNVDNTIESNAPGPTDRAGAWARHAEAVVSG